MLTPANDTGGVHIDGHRGLRFEKVNSKDVVGFRLALSALYESENDVFFVIHTKPTSWGLGTYVSPEEFLARLGYGVQKGCPVLEDTCFWLPLAELRRAPFLDRTLVEQVHVAFGEHADRLPKAYDAYKQIMETLRVLGSDSIDLFPELRNFQPLKLTVPTNGVPDWAEAELPAQYANALDVLKHSSAEVQRLRSIAGLLWDTGEGLELAVREVFRSLGYSAELEPEGKTFDITVDSGPGKRFLVEVTGIGGMLKKDSGKVTQALAALQVAEAGDRVIVAVNANRETPVKQRAKLEPVSPEALDLLKRLNVSVIETAHLFELWKTHLTDPGLVKTRINDLYAFPGGFFSRR